MTSFDEAAAKNAIAVATDFPLKIHGAAVKAQGVSLGPWSFNVSCKYGTSDKNSFSERVSVDFTEPREALQGTLGAAETQASQFLPTFQPVQVWLGVTLPQTGTQFSKAATAQATAKTELQHTESVSAKTKQALLDAFAALLATMEASTTSLSGATRALAQFEESVNSSITNIDTAKRGLAAQAQGVLTRIKADIAKMPCGQSGGTSQLNGLTAQFSSAMTAYGTIFSGLAHDTTAATQAISLLTGTVMSFESEYTPIVAQVEKAEGAALGTVIQSFDLSVASSEWNALAAYAKSQLQGARASLTAQLVSANAKAPSTAKLVAANAKADSNVSSVVDSIYGKQAA